MNSHRLKTSNTQRGAVLIVSLLILMIMTIIAVSTLSTTTLQEQMAANTANKYKTYHATESAIGLTISTKNIFKDALNKTKGSPKNDQYNNPLLGDNVDAFTDTYMDLAAGETPPYAEGYSMGRGLVAIPYVITGESTFGGSGARSRHIQGVNVLAPAP